MSYQVYLSQPQTFEEVVALLKKIPKTKVIHTKSSATVLFGAWKVRVVDFREKWVPQEAKELAARCKDPEKKALLQRSARRLELELDDDPQDNHYNDGLSVFEALYVLPGAVGLDPVTGELFR